MTGFVLLALGLVFFGGAHWLWRYALMREQRRRVGARLTQQLDRLAPSELANFLKEQRRGWVRTPRSWTELLLRAGLEESKALHLKIFGPMLLAFILVMMTLGAFAAFLFLFCSVLILYFWLWLRADKRYRKITGQIPDFLEMIVRLMTIGNSMGAAFHRAGETSPEPLRSVLERAIALHRSGKELDESLRMVSRLYGLHDLFLVASVIGVAMRFGGRSDQTLERMAAFMRDREHARHELHALSAEVRLSAWVLGLLPLLLACYILMFNNALFMGMWHDSTGKNCCSWRWACRSPAPIGCIAWHVRSKGKAMNESDFIWLLIACAALCALFAAGIGAWFLFKYGSDRHKLRKNMDAAITQRQTGSGIEKQNQSLAKRVVQTIEGIGQWALAGPLGKFVFAEEDRELVDGSGFKNLSQARVLFVGTRVLTTFFFAFVASFIPLGGLLEKIPFLSTFLGFGLGWMMPKWVLQRRTTERRNTIKQELPLFVDLIRLLQGVGLSMDQSLHTIEQEFQNVIPVLGHELTLALELYSRGRSREQSLERLANNYRNDDLAAICRLIVQVDQHGGGMQEPLNRFGERLREQRRLGLKEEVGKLTVKMTGVMVITLLPALLIVTAGSGFLALFRGLSQISGS
ncbi:type II secretion system F family protein [Paenalcaligenes niemegkensis]|uniref:type II secretion system F family protein n=1 Tax=Paenalcaligenes niemegkensis TaxID=2895469 RepID=UPI001EE96E27|nr:type II secretion system F family protein [Paenalcaligenes niemegkensis]MCQ9616987.1 type II secretion system F family protein [Paenalcaligenes niemegkensis]